MRIYNDPNGSPSSVGTTQFRTDHYYKKALIELKKEQYFMPLADVRNMPKHMGKKIKQYLYIPLLDDRNINDQGIDAATNALNAAQWSAWDASGVLQGAAHADESAAWAAAGQGGSVKQNYGNLYGSSKDIGTITNKLPLLSETGGRVNRVGFKRQEIEGSFEKLGFFDEYTKESMDFDTDEELEMHIAREMLRGAHEITEDTLQIDLLNSAGTVFYPGVATNNVTISGETGGVTVADYDLLSKLNIALDDNRTPKHTRVITGSRMVDTKVISGARVMYIGSELLPLIEKMTDHFSNEAFIKVAHYASAGDILNGEVGTVGYFRIVVVPEMLHWAGLGAAETTNDGYRTTNSFYDIFPMLVVGDGSFTTIGFQTDGKTVKFKIKHAKPESPESYALDPYGETGFMSIKWYYGFMPQRLERIGLIKTVAPM